MSLNIDKIPVEFIRTVQRPLIEPVPENRAPLPEGFKESQRSLVEQIYQLFFAFEQDEFANVDRNTSRNRTDRFVKELARLSLVTLEEIDSDSEIFEAIQKRLQGTIAEKLRSKVSGIIPKVDYGKPKEQKTVEIKQTIVSDDKSVAETAEETAKQESISMIADFKQAVKDEIKRRDSKWSEDLDAFADFLEDSLEKTERLTETITKSSAKTSKKDSVSTPAEDKGNEKEEVHESKPAQPPQVQPQPVKQEQTPKQKSQPVAEKPHPTAQNNVSEKSKPSPVVIPKEPVSPRKKVEEKPEDTLETPTPVQSTRKPETEKVVETSETVETVIEEETVETETDLPPKIDRDKVVERTEIFQKDSVSEENETETEKTTVFEPKFVQVDGTDAESVVDGKSETTENPAIVETLPSEEKKEIVPEIAVSSEPPQTPEQSIVEPAIPSQNANVEEAPHPAIQTISKPESQPKMVRSDEASELMNVLREADIINLPDIPDVSLAPLETSIGNIDLRLDDSIFDYPEPEKSEPKRNEKPVSTQASSRIGKPVIPSPPSIIEKPVPPPTLPRVEKQVADTTSMETPVVQQEIAPPPEKKVEISKQQSVENNVEKPTVHPIPNEPPIVQPISEKQETDIQDNFELHPPLKTEREKIQPQTRNEVEAVAYSEEEKPLKNSQVLPALQPVVRQKTMEMPEVLPPLSIPTLDNLAFDSESLVEKIRRSLEKNQNNEPEEAEYELVSDEKETPSVPETETEEQPTLSATTVILKTKTIIRTHTETHKETIHEKETHVEEVDNSEESRQKLENEIREQYEKKAQELLDSTARKKDEGRQFIETVSSPVESGEQPATVPEKTTELAVANKDDREAMLKRREEEYYQKKIEMAKERLKALKGEIRSSAKALKKNLASSPIVQKMAEHVPPKIISEIDNIMARSGKLGELSKKIIESKDISRTMEAVSGKITKLREDTLGKLTDNVAKAEHKVAAATAKRAAGKLGKAGGKSFLGSTLSVVGSVFGSLFKVLSFGVGFVFGLVSFVVNTAFSLVKGIWALGKAVLGVIVKAVDFAIVKPIKWVGNLLKKKTFWALLIGAALTPQGAYWLGVIAKKVVNFFSGGIKQIWENVKNLFSDIWGFVVKYVGPIWDAIWGWIKGKWEELVEKYPWLRPVDSFFKFIGSCFDSLKQFFDWIGKNFTDLCNWIEKKYEGYREEYNKYVKEQKALGVPEDEIKSFPRFMFDKLYDSTVETIESIYTTCKDIFEFLTPIITTLTNVMGFIANNHKMLLSIYGTASYGQYSHTGGELSDAAAALYGKGGLWIGNLLMETVSWTTRNIRSLMRGEAATIPSSTKLIQEVYGENNAAEFSSKSAENIEKMLNSLGGTESWDMEIGIKGPNSKITKSSEAKEHVIGLVTKFNDTINLEVQSGNQWTNILNSLNLISKKGNGLGKSTHSIGDFLEKTAILNRVANEKFFGVRGLFGIDQVKILDVINKIEGRDGDRQDNLAAASRFFINYLVARQRTLIELHKSIMETIVSLPKEHSAEQTLYFINDILSPEGKQYSKIKKALGSYDDKVFESLKENWDAQSQDGSRFWSGFSRLMFTGKIGSADKTEGRKVGITVPELPPQPAPPPVMKPLVNLVERSVAKPEDMPPLYGKTKEEAEEIGKIFQPGKPLPFDPEDPIGNAMAKMAALSVPLTFSSPTLQSLLSTERRNRSDKGIFGIRVPSHAPEEKMVPPATLKKVKEYVDATSDADLKRMDETLQRINQALFFDPILEPDKKTESGEPMYTGKTVEEVVAEVIKDLSDADRVVLADLLEAEYQGQKTDLEEELVRQLKNKKKLETAKGSLEKLVEEKKAAKVSPIYGH